MNINSIIDTSKSNQLITWLLLLLVFFIALFLRIDNFGYWTENPERFFHGDTPNILNVDGYYYLDLARDLVNRTYALVDQDRTIPYGKPRPSPAPLLSIITSKIHLISGIKLEWIALWLSSLLGSFIVIPLFLVGLQLGGRVMAFCTSIVGALSPHFLQRSTFGWFDTDSLVVILPLMIAWAAMMFSTTRSQRRWYYLASAFAFELIFLWWWDFGSAPVLAAFLIPIAVAIVFYTQDNKERNGILAITALFTTFIAIFKPGTITSFFSTFSYLNEKEESIFPASGSNVVEQMGASFPILAQETKGGWIGFALSIVGGLIFIYRFRKLSLFFVFPFLVGCLSLTAVRFLIFLAPIVALGIGSLVQTIWSYNYQSTLAIPLAAGVFVLAIGQMLLDYDRDNQTNPLRLPYQTQVFKQIDADLPKDAAIWSDWSHGYPLLYHAKRGTFADGAYHSGKMLFVLSFPLAVESPRVAANFIRFFTQRGMEGLQMINQQTNGDWDKTVLMIKRVFYAGPKGALATLQGSGIQTPKNQKKWLEFLFPPERRPVYVLLDYDKIRTPWFKFGSWNFKKSSGPNFAHEPFLQLKRNEHRIENNQFQLDTKQGVARYRGNEFVLKQINIPSKGIRKLRESGFTFELHETNNWGVLMDDQVLHSVGKKLYGGKLSNNPWLESVIDNLPLYGVWKVVPDKLDPAFLNSLQ